MPIVALSLLPADADSLEHPLVVELRQLIESGCVAYDCEMTSFAIKNGVVIVGLTRDEYANALMDNVTQQSGRPAEIFETLEDFLGRVKETLEEKGGGVGT